MGDRVPTALQTTAKPEMLDELGEAALILPSLLGRALEANDRAKYFMSLLQAARARADAPARPFASLREERLASGVARPELDEVVEASRHGDGDLYLIPDARRIHDDLVEAVQEMLAPLGEARLDESPDPARLDALRQGAPELTTDEIPGAYIDRMVSARREQGDSWHLLVMDAHRALNHLGSKIATGNLDGAAVFGLRPEDTGLIRAFMSGVHATAPLKLDHPGLATTATRVDDRLLVQNDLGTTGAHVIVFSLEELVATVTYTDVHLRRLEFFMSLLDGFGVEWGDVERRLGHGALGEHHVAVGRYEARHRQALEAYLRHAGSRLVFVLDWNRARKRLATLVSQSEAIELLRWAAAHEVGHMAFLALGAERLIWDALELASRMPARYGQSLREILGDDATLEVMRFALRAASEGVLAGKSPALIRDEVRVEILGHLRASHRQLLDVGAEHASLIVETAQAMRAALMRLGFQGGREFLARAVRRAGAWEHQADELLISQRQTASRMPGSDTVASLAAIADDAIDALEEIVFLLTLLPEEAVGVVRTLLDPLAGIAVAAAREHLKAVEIARQVVDESAPEDLQDFLVATDQVVALEHEADGAERIARADLVSKVPDFRSLYVADRIASGAEEATDVLLRSALGLRDHVLGVLSERR